MSGGYESIAPSSSPKSRRRPGPGVSLPITSWFSTTKITPSNMLIEMLIKLFAHSIPRAKELTWEIDSRGRAIVYTTHKEKAELKREQVLAYGADPRLSRSKGPLRCYIEPAVSD